MRRVLLDKTFSTTSCFCSEQTKSMGRNVLSQQIPWLPLSSPAQRVSWHRVIPSCHFFLSWRLWQTTDCFFCLLSSHLPNFIAQPFISVFSFPSILSSAYLIHSHPFILIPKWITLLVIQPNPLLFWAVVSLFQQSVIHSYLKGPQV